MLLQSRMKLNHFQKIKSIHTFRQIQECKSRETERLVSFESGRYRKMGEVKEGGGRATEQEG